MKKDGPVPEKKAAKKTVREQKPYLTKRILISAAKRGILEAAKETMQIMGYTIIAKNGWIIKKYADGRIEKIKKIGPHNASLTK